MNYNNNNSNLKCMNEEDMVNESFFSLLWSSILYLHLMLALNISRLIHLMPVLIIYSGQQIASNYGADIIRAEVTVGLGWRLVQTPYIEESSQHRTQYSLTR